MYHALDLPEILYNIFGHISLDEDLAQTYGRLSCTYTLAKLARTCRAFKEPALDVLWSELPDLSALARCVPNAVCSKRRRHYAFKRPLTEPEWTTIRGYARRVWSILDCALGEACLEETSAAMLIHHTRDMLFPSLRFLSWGYGRPFPLLHFAAHPLRTLHLDCRCGEIPECRDILNSIGDRCSFITRFRLQLSRQHVEFDSIISTHILRWTNLRILECGDVALSADAIKHISRLSTLTHLSFVLSEEASCQIRPGDLVLVFSNLTWCEISSRQLSSVANLFGRARLPVIEELTVKFPGSPSKQTIQSFMHALKNACCSLDTLTHLSIMSQRYLSRRLSICGDLGSNHCCPITYDDLRPCTAFGSLRSLKLDFDQPIHLADDLVDLGSAWPHLQDLIINNDAGWQSTGGLTFQGLIQLLRACPELCNFCVLFDTPTFTSIPEGMDVSYPGRQFGRVNLVESPLDAVTFAGVASVFAAIRFSPRLWMAWRRVEAERGAPVGLSQAMHRSWRDLGEEVKARTSSASSS